MNEKSKKIVLLIICLLLASIGLGCFGQEETEKNKDKDGGTVLTVILADGTEKTFSLTDLEEMEFVERQVEYQNQLGNFVGEGIYKAVLIKDILFSASNSLALKPGDSLKISAKDDYYQEYCYYNIYPTDYWYSFQGDFGIAYSKDGESVGDWSEGPLSVFLPEDNEYTLEDCNATSAVGQGFSVYKSAGARYVKNVVKLEVITNQANEWQVELKGELSEQFSKTDFEILEQYNSAVYTDKETGDIWSGVPLWRILGRVDDSGPIRDEGMFNEVLAAKDYKIEIKAGDGYSKELSSKLLSKNDEIILADKVNGKLISEVKHKPLRVVGSGLTSGQMVGNVVEISLELDNEPPGPTVLTVIGKTTITYDMAKLKSYPAITNSGGFKKSTGTIVGPYTYKGVSVKYLLEQTGALDADYGIEVKASDGYTMTFTKAQVEGNFVIYDDTGESLGINTVTMLLAYEEVGKNKLDGGPIQLVLVGDESPLTDGHFWAKKVVVLTIMESVKDWELELHGINDHTMNRTEFEALATCSYHKMWFNFTDKDEVEHHYDVVPLWILISTIDGIVAPNKFYFFNDFLAQVGYNITITASDGFKVTFHSSRVARNDSILVAYKDNDKPLALDNGWPLRIVGNDLSGKESIRNIKYINMTDLPQVSEWSFNLTGLTSLKVTQSFFIAMASHHLVWCNITDKGVDKHYQGIPLYYLLGAVDDGDELGHFGLNMTLALLGYAVQIKATDGFTAEFDSVRVARNKTIILAYLNDGKPLNSSQGGPVRVVGSDLLGKESVKNVADITFSGINQVTYSPGILEIIGKKSAYGQYEVNVSLNEIKGFPSHSGAGGYKNKVGNIAGPFNYTGINISSLLWLVGSLQEDDSVRITASDGYNKIFTYDEILGKMEIFDIEGNSLGAGQVIPMLAYLEEGETLSDGGPVKLVFITPIGAISSSSYWIKEVVRIEVI